MHSQPTNDTSSQAMTEVALGLSMAFFALLILALLSFQMPEQHHELAANKLNPEPVSQPAKTQKKAQEKIQIQQGKQQSKAIAGESQFIFFYQGRFFDQNLKPVELSALNQTTPVVLAVEQSLSFAEVINIRHKINHPNLSITLLSPEWQHLLEQH